MAIEDNSLVDVFDVKQHAPNVFLIANLGFAQLRQADFLSQTEKAVEMIKADALAIHLNALQEMVQVEGDRDFSGILDRLTQVCKTLSVPVIVKEVGCGISQVVADKLVDAGVSAIDVGGRGGTSWAYIEGQRASCEQTQTLAETFRNWGIPTAYSLAAIRAKHKAFPLVATGGIRDGLTLAKAVAVGADMVGLGLPLLRAALDSQEQVHECLNTFVRGLQIAMVASGSADLKALSQHIGLDEPHKVTFENLIFTG
jgi:isopentenyl-diphosphate delta-isomerase